MPTFHSCNWKFRLLLAVSRHLLIHPVVVLMSGTRVLLRQFSILSLLSHGGRFRSARSQLTARTKLCAASRELRIWCQRLNIEQLARGILSRHFLHVSCNGSSVDYTARISKLLPTKSLSTKVLLGVKLVSCLFLLGDTFIRRLL